MAPGALSPDVRGLRNPGTSGRAPGAPNPDVRASNNLWGKIAQESTSEDCAILGWRRGISDVRGLRNTRGTSHFEITVLNADIMIADILALFPSPLSNRCGIAPKRACEMTQRPSPATPFWMVWVPSPVFLMAMLAWQVRVVLGLIPPPSPSCGGVVMG